jgi:hypothetical protein
VTEDIGIAAGNLSDTGTITFDDIVLSDTHTTEVTPDVDNTLCGTLTVIVSDLTTGGGCRGSRPPPG